MTYARGTYSKAACDRCGHLYPYGTLQEEYKNDMRTGLMTCEACWDPQHPQDRPPRHIADSQALAHPRPRQEKDADNDSPKENNAYGPKDGRDYEAWAQDIL